MTASIEFKDNQGNQVSGLSDIKIITLSDSAGNKYTLDARGGHLKLKYIPTNEDKEEECTITSLADALRSLLNVKSSGDKTVLEEKVSEKPIVEAIMYAKDDNNNRISDTVLAHTFARKDDVSTHISERLSTKADKVELDKKANVDSVYTKQNIDDKLKTKVDIDDVYTKQVIDSELASRVNADRVYTKEEMDEKLTAKADTLFTYTKQEANERFFPLAEHQKLAKEILGKRINGKSVLVDELGKLFDEQELWYGNKSEQTAKDFLAEKGNFAKINGSNIMIPDFAEKILDATEDIGEGKKKSVLVEKLGKFLDQIDDNDKAYEGKTAKDFLGEKGMQGPRGSDGPAGKDGISTAPNLVAQELITNQADALGQAVLGAKDDENREILVNSSILQEGVAKKLKENPGKAIGPKGEPGQDGESPSVDAVAAQLLIGTNKDALVTEIAHNKGLQESLAINQDFSTAVVATLSNDKNFSNIVKRDLSRGEESLSVNNVVTRLLADENKTLVNAIGNNKEVAKKILAATEDTDEKKSILVEKLAGFLDDNDQAYDNNKRTAKEFLGSKGLASANASDPTFQGAVREVISQPLFEIPDDPNTPLSWNW
ncbi:hypothetical protein [Wolbachia endosymbiont (group A) of Bombylius major]|uniref:hypothetical protein n=1 Tax=Wolbachia endosymbiont (group A) of Bombylius major TaxID=2953988 RepID=UPI00223075ED|nr:hypothetical protein [Wolbachia endosymbiont (group A) of Bombylius major]